MKTGCDDYKPLLAGLLDKELTSEEKVTINEHLMRCQECREEYETMLENVPDLSLLSFQEPSDRDLARMWALPYSRLVRNSGLVLIIGGYLALLGYGVIEYFSDDGEGLFGKLSVAAMIIGGIVTLGVVIAERILTYKSDPYKEIER